MEEDEDQAILVLRQAAQQEVHEAQYALGVLCRDGRAVPQNIHEAFKFFQLAGDHGNTAALYNLGVIYASGKDFPVDNAKAVSWYRKAAELKDATAQYNLGCMYLYGRGVPRDKVEAYAWIAVAAANGDASAAVNLKKIEASLRGGLLSRNRVEEGKQRAAVYLGQYRNKN